MPSTLRTCAIAIALAAATARAEGPAPQADAPVRSPDELAPTGFGCTVETLVSGAQCVFEGAEPPAGSKPAPGTAPRWSPAALATRVCAAAARPIGEARPDPEVAATCEGEVLAALRRCALPGDPLLDAAGLFVPSARACYAAVGDATAGARTRLAATAPCCRCLAEHRCAAARACLKDGAAAALGAKGLACAARSCEQACGAALPPPAEPSGPREPTGLPAPPRTPRFDRPASETKDI